MIGTSSLRVLAAITIGLAPTPLASQSTVRLSDSARRVVLPGSNRLLVAHQGDGGLVFVDTETSEVSYLSPSSGDFRAVGRVGAGPGEYRRPTKLFRLRGDTVGVWDEALHRLLLIAPAGLVTSTIPAPQWLHAPADPVGGDTLGRIVFRIPQRGPRDSVPTALLVRWNVALNTVDTVASVDRDPTTVLEKRTGSQLSRFVIPLPFQSGDQAVVAEDGVVIVVRGAHDRIDFYSSTGSRSERLRPYGQIRIERIDVETTTVWRNAPIPWPATKSPIGPNSVLLMDRELWVQRPSNSGDNFLRYQSIGFDGKTKRELRLPVGARLIGFGAQGEFLTTRPDPGEHGETLLVQKGRG